MSKEELELRWFDCPEELFGAGKRVARKRFIKVRERARLFGVRSSEEVVAFLAEYVVEWNLDDFETGEPLDQPVGNPEVFSELDVFEQVPWLIRVLFRQSPDFPKGR